MERQPLCTIRMERMTGIVNIQRLCVGILKKIRIYRGRAHKESELLESRSLRRVRTVRISICFDLLRVQTDGMSLLTCKQNLRRVIAYEASELMGIILLMEVQSLENPRPGSAWGFALSILKHTAMTFLKFNSFFYFASLKNKESRNKHGKQNIQ